MTENEAIEVLKDFDKQVTAKADGAYQSTIGKMACDMAINALEEVQQYRAIGTPEELQTMKEHGGFTGVELAQIAAGQMKLKEYRAIGTPEECRAAVEKQTAKKVEIWNDGSEHCPCCDKNNSYLGFKVCIECGQLLDWNEESWNRRANGGETD